MKKKLETLSKVSAQLKSEFIGLDSIIDQVIEGIKGWYCAREILNRPTVIPIFGPTGTGKTSLITRLTELLDYEENTYLFDMGELTKDSKNLVSELLDLIGIDDDSFGRNELNPKKVYDPIIVLDEFTNSRTISSMGEELVNPSCRPIWELIDSGIVTRNEIYTNWRLNRILDLVQDWNFFITNPSCSSLPIDKHLTVTDPSTIDIIRQDITLGIRYSEDNDSIPLPIEIKKKNKTKPDKQNIELVTKDILKDVLTKLSPEEVSQFRDLLNRETTVGEFVDWLNLVKTKFNKPKKLNLSKSLVFVLGNLDTSFYEAASTNNADLDADTLHDITSKVTISDIKADLLNYFKPEQVGRLGNNIIIYPTLSSESFKSIIKLKSSGYLSRLHEVHPNISIDLSENFLDLIYSEGVSASQGVRSVLSALDYILMPILSSIVINGSSEAKVDVLKGDIGFKVPSVDINITYGDGSTEVYPIKLRLGSERDPYKRKKRYAASVHEAGHAVVFSWLRGIAPDQIVSVSVDNGGFCSSYDSRDDKEIKSRLDLIHDVKISMGGYCAEKIIFGDGTKLLLGSSSDLSSAWNLFNTSVYSSGFYDFHPLENYDAVKREDSCLVSGFKSDRYNKRMKEDWDSWMDSVEHIIETERKLIVRLALYLGQRGSMNSKEFIQFVKDYGNELTIESMEKASKYLDPEEYLEKLLSQEK